MIATQFGKDAGCIRAAMWRDQGPNARGVDGDQSGMMKDGEGRGDVGCS
jgi:hypothetical protein